MLKNDLLKNGWVVLSGIYSPEDVQWARNTVMSNSNFFRNTRPNPSAGHVAGFHRYPEFESLHTWITTKIEILDNLRKATGCEAVRTIGLSDITINRSQAWHVDLLRGKFQHHLDEQTCWGPDGGGVFKALVYLQPGRSLKVVSGGHLNALSLSDDFACIPLDSSLIESINVEAGDVILMDVRLPHRGSTEEELANLAYMSNQKILVSTVLGGAGKPLTRAMEIGNFERLQDWERKHCLRKCS